MIDYQSRIFQKFVEANKLSGNVKKKLKLYLEAQGLTANSSFVVGGIVYVEIAGGVITDVDGNVQMFVERPQPNLIEQQEQRMKMQQRKAERLKAWIAKQTYNTDKNHELYLQRRLESKKAKLEVIRKRRVIQGGNG